MNSAPTPIAVKPVKLQVNNSGAWKDVVRFDAADAVVSGEVMDAAATLGRIGGVSWRVCTADALQLSLMYWSAEHGWEVR
jgi:hypothetical protein